MKIIKNTLPISDIYNMMKTSELVVNRSYQRAKGLWPNNSRSYFIDTILNEFPFPKVVIRQIVDLKTKKSKREIIDGQQRLTTIRDFIENKFKLTSVSKNFKGLTFSDMDEETQTLFLSYEISVDTVTSASTEEILEIFRRINSYTLPLNKTEQRHAIYQGQFKWFISDLAEYFSPFLEKFKILSVRDISRMMDTDLLTECSQLAIDGIQTRNAKRLDDIYKKYDLEFDIKDELERKILDTFNFIKDNFIEVFDQCEVKSYNFYALIGALLFNRYGISDSKQDLKDLIKQGVFCHDLNSSRDELIRVFNEAEEKVLDGEFPDFVKASISTTHSYSHRLERIKTLIIAMQK